MVVGKRKKGNHISCNFCEKGNIRGWYMESDIEIWFEAKLDLNHCRPIHLLVEYLCWQRMCGRTIEL